MLTGHQIIEYGLITPFVSFKVDDHKTPSFGPDGCGYTLRGETDEWFIPAGKTVAFQTLETITMPDNCAGLLFIKSTYARLGLILVTDSPVDPGYNGRLTIRLFNSGDSDVIINPVGGFMMMVVQELSQHVAPYAGRWQGLGGL